MPVFDENPIAGLSPSRGLGHVLLGDLGGLEDGLAGGLLQDRLDVGADTAFIVHRGGVDARDAGEEGQGGQIASCGVGVAQVGGKEVDPLFVLDDIPEGQAHVGDGDVMGLPHMLVGGG